MSYDFQGLRKKFQLAFALGSLLCCVMLAETIKTSYLPGIDFSKYHTYKWVTIEGRQHPDPNKNTQIKQFIDSQLAPKGLVKTDDTADLSIGYQVALSKAETWKTYEDWSAWVGPYPQLPNQKKVTITVGTIVVDMYDTAGKNLVWSGTATDTIDTSDGQEQQQKPAQKRKNIEKAIRNLLKVFPPK